jgi:shikimate dehydrogenase
MRKFGLIGYPLGHSFSAGYFANKFKMLNNIDAQYQNYPIDSIEKFRTILSNNIGLIGLNVTIPYKQQIIPYLNELSEGAQQIGAVNCIKIINKNTANPYLIGYNTDEYGFRKSLIALLKPYHKSALVLGTGGASKAVEYVLKSLNINYKMVSREPKGSHIIAYSQIDKTMLDEHQIVINTTPLGMAPDINKMPDIPYQHLNSTHLLFDLIYNPEETLFMKKGKEYGAKVTNGLEMLHGQAEKAWEIWNS